MRLYLSIVIVLAGPMHPTISQIPTAGQANVRQHYERGVELLRADKVENAAEEFQAVLKASPQSAAAYNMLGVCYSRLGRLQAAHHAFEQAVRLDPSSVEARNNLGASYLTVGKPGQAAEQFEQSIRLKPDDSSALFNLGRTRLLMKEAGPSVAVLSRALKLAPHDAQVSLALAEAYFVAGNATSAVQLTHAVCAEAGRDSDSQLAAGQILLRYGRSQDAQACFVRAAAADPSASEKMVVLASRLLDDEEYHAALQMLTPLANNMSNSAAYHDLLGSAYSKVGQPIPAIHAFQKALRLDPENEDYYLDLGQVLEQYDAYDAAIELFHGAVARHPKSPRLYVGLALACLPAARMTEAREAAERAIKLDPRLETAYTTVAMVYQGEKDWRALLRNAQQLKTLSPRNYLGWYYAGVAEMELPAAERSASRAIEGLRRAATLNPKFALAHFQLGRLMLEQKQYATAIAELKRSIVLDPNYPEAHFVLARAYQGAGELPKAEAQLEIHRRLIAETESRPRPHLEVIINTR
jgi:tetratricopeptide (TPR) repeat protein